MLLSCLPLSAVLLKLAYYEIVLPKSGTAYKLSLRLVWKCQRRTIFLSKNICGEIVQRHFNRGTKFTIFTQIRPKPEVTNQTLYIAYLFSGV